MRRCSRTTRLFTEPFCTSVNSAIENNFAYGEEKMSGPSARVRVRTVLKENLSIPGRGERYW